MDELNQNQMPEQQTTEQAPQQNTYQQAPQQNTYQQAAPVFEEPVYVAPVTTYKQKSNAAKWIIIAAAGILAIAAIVIILIVFVFNNKSAYEKAERKTLDQLSNALSATVSGADAQLVEDLRSQIDITFNTDELPEEIAQVIDLFSDLSITTETASSGDTTLINSTFSMNGSEILDQNIWLSLSESGALSFIYALPGVTDITFAMQGMPLNLNVQNNVSEEDREVIESFLNDVLNAYFSYTSKYPLQTGKSFTTENAKYDADMVVINLTYEDVFGLLKEISSRIYNNDKFFNWLDKIFAMASPSQIKQLEQMAGGMSISQYTRSLFKSIADGSLDSLTSMMTEDLRKTPLFTMNVYIKNDVIVCRKIVAGDTVITLTTLFEENVTDLAFVAETAGKETANITFYNEVIDGKNNGSATVVANKEPVLTLSYKNLTISEDTLDGTITIVSGPASYDFTLTTVKNGDNTTITADAKIGNMNIATITATSGPSTLTFEQAPAIGSNTIDISDIENEKNYDLIQQLGLDITAYIEELAEENPFFSILSMFFDANATLPESEFDYFEF